MAKDTVSLEVAGLLHQKGWKKETHYAWVFDEISQGGFAGVSDKEEPAERAWVIQSPMCSDDFKDSTVIAAPTIGELLEALPKDGAWILSTRMEHKNRLGEHFGPGWYAQDKARYGEMTEAETPADALGLLWLALKEKGNLLPLPLPRPPLIMT